MHALEEPGEVGDLDAVQPAIEQLAQRQHAAALLANRDDDLVDLELADRLLQRLACRTTIRFAETTRSVTFSQREEPDELESGWMRRGQRGLDQARLGTGAEHEDPVREHRP